MDIRRNIKVENYNEYVEKTMPKSPVVRQCLKAFMVGGAICVVGQCLLWLATGPLALGEEEASAFCCIVMVFLGALFTGLGVYDVLGNFAGAGSIVPISGFANSVVSPAMEFRREGLVLGVGAKLFTIAGPVLVYGIGASVVCGGVYYLLGLLGVV
ncbi:MAG: stage V sporulation protein AC [Christensenellaceae bacterium]|nr:stage V sporulation protein AC [Christensenellaceae bacterium]